MGESDGPAEAKLGSIMAPKSVEEPINPYDARKLCRGSTAGVSKFEGMTVVQLSVASPNKVGLTVESTPLGTFCTNKPPISAPSKFEEYVETSEFQLKSPRKSNVESIASPAEPNLDGDAVSEWNAESGGSSVERNSGNNGAIARS
jgi:hypothetical protein